jgi:methyltransferase-like protein
MIVSAAGEYPQTTGLVRWQAENHRLVTTLRHVPIQVDEMVRQILPLLDGTRDREALAAELSSRKAAAGGATTDNPWPSGDPQRLKQMIDTVLNGLAGASLLVKG